MHFVESWNGVTSAALKCYITTIIITGYDNFIVIFTVIILVIVVVDEWSSFYIRIHKDMPAHTNAQFQKNTDILWEGISLVDMEKLRFIWCP
jgi:hypothetical protein